MEIASDTKDHTKRSTLGTKVKLREGRGVFDHALNSVNNYPVRKKIVTPLSCLPEESGAVMFSKLKHFHPVEQSETTVRKRKVNRVSSMNMYTCEIPDFE